MMRSAYEQGSSLPLAQRVALLSRLLYTLPPKVMAAEKKQWAEELFAAAQKLPVNATGSGAQRTRAPQSGGVAWDDAPDSFREEAIATAAVRLAMYDPDRSLELLDSLPSGGGKAEDARTMAARLVFAIYLRRHGAAGAPELLAHARQWGRHGGFPYAASATVLATLSGSGSEDAAEDFFQQVSEEFSHGREGWHGVREFAGFLERAVALSAISEESAETAGEQVVAQLQRLASAAQQPGSRREDGAGSPRDAQLAAAVADVKQSAAAGGTGANAAETATAAAPTRPDTAGERQAVPLSWDRLSAAQRQDAEESLEDVRVTAPAAYAEAENKMPQFTAPHAAAEAAPVAEPKVDAELQAAFNELAAELHGRRGRRHRQALRHSIEHAVQLVNARYAPAGTAAAGGGRLMPDAQSSALISLAAYASPMTVATELQAIDAPYWRAFFTVIAAQEVGQPARVADPTSHYVIGKEEAEPEEQGSEPPDAEPPDAQAPDAQAPEAQQQP